MHACNSQHIHSPRSYSHGRCTGRVVHEKSDIQANIQANQSMPVVLSVPISFSYMHCQRPQRRSRTPSTSPSVTSLSMIRWPCQGFLTDALGQYSADSSPYIHAIHRPPGYAKSYRRTPTSGVGLHTTSHHHLLDVVSASWHYHPTEITHERRFFPVSISLAM
jgi:hypothetical protein